jgi:hypothetical protein
MHEVDYPDVRSWCQDAQALKIFVWILFAGGMLFPASSIRRINTVNLVLYTTFSITRYAILQHRHGNTNIWLSALSRFDPRAESDLYNDRASSIFGGRLTMTDYFGTGNGSGFAAGVDSKW